MTPAEFIKKWHNNSLSERAGAQPYFLDLCAMLGVETPNDPDNYCFERGVAKTGAGRGWADVWKRNHFGWENKSPGKDLAAALGQLMLYALPLESPPLLVVTDREIIQIHTHFTGTPSEVHTILLEDIGTAENQQKLRWLFTDPEKFRPGRTVTDITEAAAGQFADVAGKLIARGHDPQDVAHFLIQCLFCMFAEDVKLLPDKLFQRLLEKRKGDGLRGLFEAMQSGGEFGVESILWFNGGLFATVNPIPLEPAEYEALLRASKMDWGQIEPSIFGTLFERGLNPALRSQLGAHYTDPVTIMKIVRPVVIDPLISEWQMIVAEIDALRPRFAMSKAGKRKDSKGGVPNAPMKKGYSLLHGFLDRLRNFRVLDAACGSANFLYLALKSLKDIEHRVNLDAEALGLHRAIGIECSPANVLGIEINPYAAELARVTVWIGEIQWMLNHGYPVLHNPILRALDHIECRDALINPDGSEADWPACDAVIGNPPFLGDKKMRSGLGDTYVDVLRNCFKDRVPGGADLVTYWFEKARAQIEAMNCKAAGLVATNSIRDGASRKVLDRIANSTQIFEAWSDEPWINDGAAVRVSLICFGDGPAGAILDGSHVSNISNDLSAGGDGFNNLTLAATLLENRDTAFIGSKKFGAFDIPGNLAREWLRLPNPNGKPNSEVLFPWANGMDVLRRPSDTWIIDFGLRMTEADASLYDAPFAYAVDKIMPVRTKNRREWRAEFWWRHGEPQPKLREKLRHLERVIVTPEVSKHRIFRFLPEGVAPDGRLVVICRSDDATFGMLSSRFHTVWALAIGSRLEDRPCYNPSRCFAMFPFPAGLTPNLKPEDYTKSHSDAIAATGKRLNDLRENWLNPPEWTERVPEIVPGYPDRIVAKAGHEKDLAKRTLTNLYNEYPAWLAMCHEALDKAVADAYGWTDYTSAISDETILSRLLDLNLKRNT